MRWKVEVCGHPFDLANLSVAVGGLHTSAFRDGEKTFLHAEAFEQMDSATEVNQAAQALIGTVNASLRLCGTATQPVTVGPVVNAQGVRTYSVGVHLQARSRIEASAETVGGDTIREPPPSTEPVLAKCARLIAADPDVARAAKFFNEPDEAFGSLAKALEIVKDDLGQGNQERGGKAAAAISGVKRQRPRSERRAGSTCR
jgi:hypothetical protein